MNTILMTTMSLVIRMMFLRRAALAAVREWRRR